MRVKLILISLICGMAAALPADAVTVAEVLDSVSFRGSDGRVFRLAGLAGPRLDPFQDQDALRRLLSEPPGRAVALAEEGLPDRYGRYLIQAYLPDRRWLNGLLVEQGLARVSGQQDIGPEMLGRLLALEGEARLAGRGRWGQAGGFRIIAAEPFEVRAGRFMLVRGRVLDVAARSKFTYLNFGPNWRKDFTVGIPKSLRRAFARAGRDPDGLVGREILVRGWVEWRNGPFIQLENPLLLQLP